MTAEVLKQCMPFASDKDIKKYLLPIGQLFTSTLYNINTKKRRAAFLAQIAHESGSLRYVRELADGKAYEGRKDLGNVMPGDGVRFKGRGLIQITGRTNYQKVGNFLHYDFIADPEGLEKPYAAVLSAGWFWLTKGLNELADREDFKLITKRINGGYNGLSDRLDHWERCKKADL